MTIVINKIPSTCSMVEVGNIPHNIESLPSPVELGRFVQEVKRRVDKDESMWNKRVAIANSNSWICTWFTNDIKRIGSYMGNCGKVHIYLINLL